jgi:hypothetical protein
MGSESSPVEDQGSGMLVAATAEEAVVEMAVEMAVERAADRVAVRVDEGTLVDTVGAVKGEKKRGLIPPLVRMARSR